MPANPDPTFHRWSGEYLTQRDWPEAPAAAPRVALALGPAPLDNARHLLHPIAVPSHESAAAPARIELLSAENQLDLRLRFARSVEMRLMAVGRRFPARDVWRAAYALGLRWGDMDLFHWRSPSAEPGQRRALFTVSAAGEPAYFLPERAAEGESVSGLVLSFELPGNPSPVETYDRMAVALNYFRQQFGGRPVAADGRELDYDRLHDGRDALAETVRAMTEWGIPPGSPAAARFF